VHEQAPAPIQHKNGVSSRAYSKASISRDSGWIWQIGLRKYACETRCYQKITVFLSLCRVNGIYLTLFARAPLNESGIVGY